MCNAAIFWDNAASHLCLFCAFVLRGIEKEKIQVSVVHHSWWLHSCMWVETICWKSAKKQRSRLLKDWCSEVFRCSCSSTVSTDLYCLQHWKPAIVGHGFAVPKLPQHSGHWSLCHGLSVFPSLRMEITGRGGYMEWDEANKSVVLGRVKFSPASERDSTRRGTPSSVAKWIRVSHSKSQ